MIRRLGVAGLIVLLLTGGGCGETNEDLPAAPYYCEHSEAETGSFRVKVTINGQHAAVPIAILLGPLEDDSLLLADTVATEFTTYELATEQDFTATALYTVGPDTILVMLAPKSASKQTLGTLGSLSREIVESETFLETLRSADQKRCYSAIERVLNNYYNEISRQ